MQQLSPAPDFYAKVTELCAQFQQLKEEINGLHRHDLSDASLQLHHVLQSTEDATNVILDSATSIEAIARESACSEADRDRITALVTTVYEACCFQDITGQRIKKVLNGLQGLESSFTVLTQMTALDGGEVKTVSPKTPEDSLMNGPQFPQLAMSQENVNKLFD